MSLKSFMDWIDSESDPAPATEAISQIHATEPDQCRLSVRLFRFDPTNLEPRKKGGGSVQLPSWA